ncbi:hypothetical protein [Lentibacillus salinarum]|uniref:Uncharacterized protein n=1 Tax=Lentibacillus salinarum TaxID=446820 RepID=A0ABW3ZU45_9BACI
MKMGWFGWTLTSVIAVTVLGSVLFFFNLFDLRPASLLNDSDNQATEAEDLSDDEVANVEEVREEVGQEHQDIGQFVSDAHDFYNETTGYGAISSLDWSEQREEADVILETLDAELPDVTDETLQDDLEHIQELAENVKNEEESEVIRDLHRMFHDLDIALNNYNTYDKIWNATETLTSTN